MEIENTIHQRLLQLRDIAVVSGSEGSSRLGYDCVTDALVAVYNECSTVSSLKSSKDVSRFLKTYKPAMDELCSLRLREDDFDTVGVIGRGHFGEVRVVKERSTKDTFAMKIMKKAHILQQADAAFFLEERDIMAYGQSQWLTKLHYAFQNEHSLYLVMDFHPGGDLFTIMERKDGGMGEKKARFYIAEIIAGLHDLHKLGFAHRDVKPDNVLIARSGHIKLVDFGSASRLDKHGNVTDMTLPVGTPEYISPEVLTSLDKKTEYGVCCDWWSVGIILYELLYDVTPFEGVSTVQTYANIMSHEETLKFPDNSGLTKEGRSLIENLLVSTNKRIGHDDLLKHLFFVNTDWENLNQMVPPYVPSLTGTDDLSNFDNFDDDNDESDVIPPAGKNPRSFVGKDLPFVGFSFMGWSESQALGNTINATSVVDTKSNIFSDLGNMASDIKRALETTQSELKESKEANSVLEKECIVYKSQLEDLQRKLDVERQDRRMSDSKALQLLSEIREQGKVAQNLREAQTKEANNKMEGAVSQLEEDRLTVVKRAQRLREELKKKSVELDNAGAKINDLRSKLSKVMENGRRDVDSIQTKLQKVTDSSQSRIGELQKENYETHDKIIKLEKEIEKLKADKLRHENKLSTITLSSTLNNNEEVHKLQYQVSELLREKKGVEQKLQEALEGINESSSKCSQVTANLKILEEQVEEMRREREERDKKHKKELESAKSDIARLNKEKKTLLTTCENLSAERDNKNTLLKQHHKNIESLSTDKDYLQSKIKELEALSSQHDITTDETVKALKQHIDHLELERKKLEEKVVHAEEMTEKALVTEATSKERRIKIVKLEDDVTSLKQNLSETTSSALRNGEKVTELSGIKKSLESEIAVLNTIMARQQEQSKQDLSRAEALTKEMEDKYTALLAKVDRLEESRRESDRLPFEGTSLCPVDTTKDHIAVLKTERDKAVADERKASRALADLKKQFESQELSVALMKRNVSSLEDQLADATATIREKIASYSSFVDEKSMIEQDLDTAENKVETLSKQLSKEKGARSVLEHQSSELRCRLEHLTSSNKEEIDLLKTDLETQKQLSSQYSEKLSELQKKHGLKELYCRETERSLEIERALTAKLYDDLHTIGREHGKLKASYLKVVKKFQNQEQELKDASREKEKALIEKATIEESIDMERNKLQTQLAQFNKLVEITPNVKTRGARSLKLGRKKRDPAKELDNWNKLRKLAKERGGSCDTLSMNSPDSQSIMSGRLSQVEYVATPISSMKTPVNKITDTPSAVSTASAVSLKKGTKRTAPDDNYCTMIHNIPHRWVTKSSRFHKSHSCSLCDGAIKHTQKFSKCSCCSLVCHPNCAESMANSCGLPQTLASQICTVSPQKKTRPETPLSVGKREDSTGKENIPSVSKIPRRLSIDLIRCQVSSTPTVCSDAVTTASPCLPGNATDLSITSSMLEDSSCSAIDYV